MNRKQTPSPQKKAQTKSSGRSEELDEIIDRMPMAFGKWVAPVSYTHLEVDSKKFLGVTLK